MSSKNLKSAVMFALFACIIAAPMILLFIIGEAKHDLEGETDHAFPAFNIGEFFNGTYQINFENWFSTKYPLRPEIVEIYGIIDAGKDSINLNFLRDFTPILIDREEISVTELLTEEEIIIIEPRFPEYNLPKEELRDPDGYRGTDHVIIGKNGALYENGYINEYLGYAPKYVNVTDEDIISRVETLKYIQDALAKRGVAFCVAITPSKASAMPDHIPDWYIAMHRPISNDYVRPYLRFLNFLEEHGVYHVDSSSLYKSLGLTNTFPKTGIHWNKFAAFETSVAIIDEYERQTGNQIKRLAADEIRFGRNPPGFGNPENDIFGIVYAGRSRERENAVVDERYYWHDAYTARASNPNIPHMIIQGGSFMWDFFHYFQAFNIASEITGFYYNNNGHVNINWEYEIGRTSFVLLEVNEQFVYNMGGVSPTWGEDDIRILPLGENIIDSLYEYLRNN